MLLSLTVCEFLYHQTHSYLLRKNLIVVVFGRAITGAVIGRAKGVGGLDDVVDVDLMLALSANMRSN